MDVGTLFTVIGGLSGLAGFGIAICSKFYSQRANELAKRSNQRASESVTLAKESNRIAVDARELAQEANAISSRAEARDTEPNYVSWDYHWKDSATCYIFNTGQQEALDVVATVAVDGEYLAHPAVDIKPGHGVAISLPVLLSKLRNDVEEFRAKYGAYLRRKDAFEARQSEFGPVVPFLEMEPIHTPLKFDVIVTIQWRSPLGNHFEKTFKDTDCVIELS